MTGAQEKWDAIYRQQDSSPATLDTLHDYDYLLPTSGTALDLACGWAGNAELLARRGLQVSAWDVSPVVIERVVMRFAQQDLSVDAQARDILNHPPSPNSFDVIVVSRFLERALTGKIIAALNPDGVLVYQTFARDKVTAGGPSNPDYLLAAGELLELFSGLTPRVFFDLGSCGDVNRGLRNESLLIAQKAAK